MDIIKLVREEETELVSLRRYLHQYPELSGQEEKTIAFIKTKLTEYQIPFIEVDNGGIIGTIEGHKEGKTVLLRADIDALPIDEDTCNSGGEKKAVISSVKGVQHACGHDGHMAMLLIAGKILNQYRDTFTGKILLCFERGEEANFNVRYLLDYFQTQQVRIDACYGIHVSPYLETGQIMIQEGPLMAGLMPFEFKVIGTGGHGSRPDLVNSPIDCFSALYQALSELRLKMTSPFVPLSYSLGSVNSGSKANIIPEELVFNGTVRYYDVENVAVPFRTRMLEMFEQIAKAYNCRLEYSKPSIFLPLNNDSECTKISLKAVSALFESDLVTGTPWMGSESFAYYSLLAPVSYSFLGTNNTSKGIGADVHNSKHDLDETVLYKGCCIHIANALEFLKDDTERTYVQTSSKISDIFTELGYKL